MISSSDLADSAVSIHDSCNGFIWELDPQAVVRAHATIGLLIIAVVILAGLLAATTFAALSARPRAELLDADFGLPDHASPDL